MSQELKDGDVIYCAQHDGAFVWRPEAWSRMNQMCRCTTTAWRVLANIGPAEAKGQPR